LRYDFNFQKPQTKDVFDQHFFFFPSMIIIDWTKMWVIKYVKDGNEYRALVVHNDALVWFRNASMSDFLLSAVLLSVCFLLEIFWLCQEMVRFKLGFLLSWSSAIPFFQKTSFRRQGSITLFMMKMPVNCYVTGSADFAVVGFGNSWL
jgi:hypothetical protein